MPIIDEKLYGDVKTVYFEESPIMSTYLVAVVVGLFDHIEDTTSDGMHIAPETLFNFLTDSFIEYSNFVCRGEGSCILPCWEE